MHVQDNNLSPRERNLLTVENPAEVTLVKRCDMEKAAIWAMYYGLNQQTQTTLLCDNGDLFETHSELWTAAESFIKFHSISNHKPFV